MTRRTVLAVAALLVLPAVLAGCGRDLPASAQIGVETVASDDREDVVAISGTTLDGEPLDLADLRGRIVVLNNWASWCVPCREETPAFVSLSETADPADILVVGLNVTDDPASARAFVTEFGMPYPSIEDQEGDLLASIPGIPPASLPSTVVLDRDGRIAARIIGGTDAMELATILAEVVEEGTPPA